MDTVVNAISFAFYEDIESDLMNWFLVRSVQMRCAGLIFILIGQNAGRMANVKA
jgi:hypothetical protein